MEIKKITDKAFAKYGRVIADIDFTELVENGSLDISEESEVS